MLVAALLFEIQPTQAAQLTGSALDWLCELQRPDGLLVGTRYTGMAVSLFSMLPADTPKHRLVVENGLNYLVSSLRPAGCWTAASWSNYYALKALFDGGRTLGDPTVAASVDWF